uniref:Keratinocyte associated protein 3 n=1 Tax=Sphenodon punctatus TaxID=8508 RepID=A0A8D0GZF3_SPHPU
TLCNVGRGPQQLMRTGIALIVLGHVNFVLGAIVHGSVLRHVARPKGAVTSEYTVANVISVVSGLLSITTGILAILASRNLLHGSILHWALFCVSLLNSLLSAACSLGLALAMSLTISNRGRLLLTGCNSSALPANAQVSLVADCPFDTTRIYDTALALWLPSMVMAAVEAALSVRCCLVSLILRGVGPCADSYLPALLQEQMAEAAAAVEEEPRGPELHQLLGAEGGRCP